jgi:hypothetical protein
VICSETETTVGAYVREQADPSDRRKTASRRLLPFRIVAPMSFKVNSVAARAGLTLDEARDMIHGRQRKRDSFLKDFLGVMSPTDALSFAL